MRRATRVLVAAAVALLVVGTGATAARPSGPADDGPPDLPGFQHGWVNVDDARIHYATGGSGPPMLLLHGWAQTWWIWRHVAPELAKDHTIIAVDLPGLGDSTAPADGYDFKTTAARVREVVHSLGYDRIDILAHDIGSSTVYRYARDFPDEVRKLFVSETMLPGFGAEEDYGNAWHYRFLQSPEPVPENIVDEEDVPTFYNYFYDGAARYPDRIAKEEFLAQQSDPAERHVANEYYRAFPEDTEQNREDIEQNILKMPVLAMGAQYAFAERVAQVYNRVADDVRGVVAPDSGRWIPEENPEFVVGCARLFFEDAPYDPATVPTELKACTP